MILPIEPLQQETSYTCVASVLQMLSRYYIDFAMTHDQAIVLTKCDEDGAALSDIAKVLDRRNRKLKRVSQVRWSLRNKHPVIADDNVTYVDSHAILILGYTPKGLWFADPSTGTKTWRPDDWFDNSTEFLVLDRTNTEKA